MNRLITGFFALWILSFGAFSAAWAGDDAVEKQVVLSNHVFDPQEVVIPANTKVKLTVVNKDASAAEFESDELNREKVVPANGQSYVYIGPLDAGTYNFVDDFHRSTTTGKITVK